MPTNSCAQSMPDLAGAFDYCAPNYVFGEIEEIIIAPLEVESGDPYPSDITSEAAWDDLLAPDAGDPIAFKIPVRGTIDEPDRPIIETSLYRKAYPPKTYNLPVNVDDLSDKAFDELLKLTNTRVRMWYISGGYLFGGTFGIEADTDSWPVIEEGEDAMHRVHIHFSWRTKERIQRVASPFVPAATTPTPTV